jgi:hypothetical protein
MMKKSGVVAALTVAVLVMALLVTIGCQEPPLTGGPEAVAIGANPEKGVVRLNFGNNTGKRTVMPADPGFVRIELVFTDSSSATFPDVITGSPITMPATISPAIELDPGTYTMTVTAYSAWTDATTNTPVAFATTATGGGITSDKDIGGGTGFTIIADQTTDIDVELKPRPAVAASGNGTLSWAINIGGISKTILAASMTIRDYAAPSAAVGQPISIQAGNSSRVIPSGYYWLDFSITSDDNKKIIARDLAHIYYNMTSPLSITFTDADFYPAIPSQGGEIKYLHPQDQEFTILPESGASANPVDGDGTAGDRLKLSLSDNIYPRDMILTLVNASDFSSYSWQYGANILESTAVFGVDIADTYFDEEGDCMVTLVGEKGGAPYTLRIYFHIYN